ncbi:conserved hypothetical protein (putative transposase or invertase) [Lentibacillus persicus]|uniref:Rpn family recombination-promoting nuclease/putative transposase n=1 Tax=Lentibacillus persicus TaxID=640948 RepID=A0A1I1SHP1_9BACI|nr:Rpn family recombination-promoting nuclease/putative transposase [Lentibacillus persicus]SFD44158.1 conserved hypothetical protein (putative transposase or invertase) [Lentibacillus persicus]
MLTQSRETVFGTVREDSNNYSSQNENKMHGKTNLLKRISLEKLMDLKVDYAFKQLFGNEKNKAITVVFLNAILQRTGRKRITDISFSNTDVGGEYYKDKKSSLDLLVLTKDNEWINVEIQFANKYDMVKRSLFYWSRLYDNSLKEGMRYQQLRSVIAINIVNFNLFSQTDLLHTSYHLYEDEEQFKLTDVMEFHFIEMPKLIKDWKANNLDPWNDVLARWLMMLGMVDSRNGEIYNDIYRELEVIAMNDDSLREAFENWEELSMTQEQRLAYESRLKQILDDESFKQSMKSLEEEAAKKEQMALKKEQEASKKAQEASKKAQEASRVEQKAQKRMQDAETKEQVTERRMEKTAHKLLVKGMDMAFVADATGLSMERIAEIKDEIEM